jgi:acyl-coenzyme A thioesterase PaaI-like protein
VAIGIKDTEANSMLTAYAKGTSYSGNAAFWVKLHTADPGSAGTTAPAGNTTRQQATFGTASGGAISTSADLVWTNVSTAETYTHVSFWTLTSGGSFLGSDDLAAPKTVAVGDTFTIASGNLTLNITPVAA